MVKLVWFHPQPMNKTIKSTLTEEHAGGVVPFSWKRTERVGVIVEEFTR